MLNRRILASGLTMVVSVASACGWTHDRPAQMDLLSVLDTAERRAASDVSNAVRADVFAVGGDARMALVMEAPARATWTVRLPVHATLQTALAGSGRLRVGVSNGRTYQALTEIDATGAWTPVTIDLREFSEVKWSLFHQPLREDWRVILNADVTSTGATVALDRPLLTKS